MIKINVFTADEQASLSPKEAIGKYFISLGSQHHNYGVCYQLICWISISGDSNDNVENPCLSLIYTFEFNNCKVAHQVPIVHVIEKVKFAIKCLSQSDNRTLYHDYMLISSKRSLDQLLLDYSYYMYQVKMADRIKSIWMYHYYTPTSKICIRIRTRQFMCLQEELSTRPKYNS